MGRRPKYMPRDCRSREQPTDFILSVEGQRLEVHSWILGKHSRYFQEIFNSQKFEKMWRVDGKPMMIFDDSIAVKDMDKMLDFLYGVQRTFEGVEEAGRMLYMAERLDVPKLLEISTGYLCEKSDQMHFFEVEARKEVAEDTMDSNSLARWLSVGDRLNIPQLRRQCQTRILWEMLQNAKDLEDEDKVRRVFMAVERNAVSPKRVYEICFAILHAVSKFSALDKGQNCSAESQPTDDGNRASSTEGQQRAPKDSNSLKEGTEKRCYSPIIDMDVFYCYAASYLESIPD